MTAALDLAARGLGDTIAPRSLLDGRGYARRLARVASTRRCTTRSRSSRAATPISRPPRARSWRWPSGASQALALRADTINRMARRDRRRRGIPPDDLLAAGGRAADDRRQRRARHAALRADRARDGRAAGARRLHHARRRQVDLLHRRRARARRGDRPPPPADRALPDRRARRSRGTTCTRRPSGSSTRCRRCSRRACWPRSGTRRRARTAIRSSPATRIEGVPLGDVEDGRQGHRPALRERGRGPAAPVQATRASSPAARARWRRSTTST